MSTLRSLLLLLGSLLALACQSEDPIAAPTQVTVRLTATPELKERMTDLRVSASVLDRSGWRAPARRMLSASSLAWPVDLPIHPRSSKDETKTVEVVVDAWANGRRLAQARAVSAFRQGFHLVLELHIASCPGGQQDLVCASDDCHGPDCQQCNADGVCEPVGLTDPTQLVVETSGAGGPVVLDSAVAPTADSGAVNIDGGGVDAAMNDRLDATVSEPDADRESGSAPSPDATSPMEDAGPAPECSATRACSSGFNCVAGSCVSACEQTTCPSGASCALVGGSPSCACGMGYVATGSGASLTCVLDRACSELGCHANATCQREADQLLHCRCNPGYTGTGTTCAPASCGTPMVSNGSATISGNGQPTYGNRATFTCSAGYQLDLLSASSATCGSDGRWSASGTCSPVDCGSPGTITQGTVSTSNGARYMSVATFSCTQGSLSGPATRTCQANGRWSGSVPTCLYCGDSIVSAPETCDPRAPLTNEWSCPITTCRRSTLYGRCAQTSDCGSGEICGAGFCSKTCTTVADCGPVPASSGATQQCLYRCVAGCATNANCPAGLVCDRGVCSGCRGTAGASPACPSGQTCLGVGADDHGYCL